MPDLFKQSIRFFPAHLPISTANPITFPILLLFVVLGVFVSVICHRKAKGWLSRYDFAAEAANGS